jgi:putative intracellular protease/amidase
MFKHLLIATAALALLFTAGHPALSAEPASTPQVMAQELGIPAYEPRFNREKPVIAVIAENTFTELTDLIIPYGVLAESGVAQVFALAMKEGPVQMFPALRIEAQATVAQFDERFPEGADYVVVPAVHRADDVALLAWISSQASKGATMVGVCDGVWVLANAGLLKGRKAVGHWYSLDALARKFPDTEWLRNTRYVADGKIITTTGVTASIPVSVALVEAIAGPERASALALTMGIANWSAEHQSDRFKLRARHVFTATGNWLARWSHEDIGLPLAEGVDEVALALVADAYSRTYRSRAFSLSPTAERVRTRRGLVVLPDRAQGQSQSQSQSHRVARAVDRTVALPVDMPSLASLDASLQAIEALYGPATSALVALQLEYTRP